MSKEHSCADPESFIRGDPTLTLFFFLVDEARWGEEGSKYHYKRAIIGPPASCHVDDGPTLNAGFGSFVMFQGIQTSIAEKVYRNPIFL